MIEVERNVTNSLKCLVPGAPVPAAHAAQRDHDDNEAAEVTQQEQDKSELLSLKLQWGTELGPGRSQAEHERERSPKGIIYK